MRQKVNRLCAASEGGLDRERDPPVVIRITGTSGETKTNYDNKINRLVFDNKHTRNQSILQSMGSISYMMGLFNDFLRLKAEIY